MNTDPEATSMLLNWMVVCVTHRRAYGAIPGAQTMAGRCILEYGFSTLNSDDVKAVYPDICLIVYDLIVLVKIEKSASVQEDLA